jgi:hypothetical protein
MYLTLVCDKAFVLTFTLVAAINGCEKPYEKEAVLVECCQEVPFAKRFSLKLALISFITISMYF